MKSRKPLPVTSIRYQSSIRHPRSAGRSRGTAGFLRDLSEAPGAAGVGAQNQPPPFIFTEALSRSPLKHPGFLRRAGGC